MKNLTIQHPMQYSVIATMLTQPSDIEDSIELYDHLIGDISGDIYDDEPEHLVEIITSAIVKIKNIQAHHVDLFDYLQGTQPKPLPISDEQEKFLTRMGGTRQFIAISHNYLRNLSTAMAQLELLLLATQQAAQLKQPFKISASAIWVLEQNLKELLRPAPHEFHNLARCTIKLDTSVHAKSQVNT